MKNSFGRAILFLIVLGAVLLLAIQFIPYGRNHTNPPVVKEPQWANPETRALAKRACFDCHSNETVWPWYSNVAPASWLVQRDVDEARMIVNFSDWNGAEIDELVEVIDNGIMPPAQYLPMHPGAQLTAAEKKTLIEGLQKTVP